LGFESFVELFGRDFSKLVQRGHHGAHNTHEGTEHWVDLWDRVDDGFKDRLQARVGDQHLPPSPAAAANNDVKPDHTAATLREAVEIIERNAVRIAPKLATALHPAAKPAAPPPSAPPAAKPAGIARLEAIAEQILVEVRRRNEQGVTDFSVSKLLAGVIQILVLATLFLGYLRGTRTDLLQIYLLVALTLQTMTISLLIMSRQK